MIPVFRGEAGHGAVYKDVILSNSCRLGRLSVPFHENSEKESYFANPPREPVPWYKGRMDFIYICPPEQIEVLAGAKGESYVLYFDLTHQFHMGFRWS